MHGDGLPSGRSALANMIDHQHLPHVSSFHDNPIVFFTACTHKRRKLLACAQSHAILRGVWERSAERDGWWVGHYILMPDHVHFFARRAPIARPMADWMKMWKSVSSRQLAGALDIAPPIWQPEYLIGAVPRKLRAKMELRGPKCLAGWIDQRRRRMAIPRFDL